MITDFLGKSLVIGDKVVFVHKYYKMASNLRKGTVKRFTPQKVEVEFTYDGSKPYRKLIFTDSIIRI